MRISRDFRNALLGSHPASMWSTSPSKLSILDGKSCPGRGLLPNGEMPVLPTGMFGNDPTTLASQFSDESAGLREFVLPNPYFLLNLEE